MVWGDEGEQVIVAGRHRALACIEAKVPFGPYRVLTCKAGDLPAWIEADNDHRRHMSLQQRRKKAADRLKADPQQTDIQIGLAVGLSDKTVASVRAELVACSQIPSVDDRMDSRKREGRRVRARAPERRSVGAS